MAKIAKRFLVIKTDGETEVRSQCGAPQKSLSRALDLKARMRAQQQMGSSNGFWVVPVVTTPGEPTGLVIGQNVRVYRAHASGSLRLKDPATGRPHRDGDVDGDFVIGNVREHRDGTDFYRVTVIRNGVEMYVDWMSRHWIRTFDEPAVTVKRH